MGQRLRIDVSRVAVDEDEIGPLSGLQRSETILGEAGISSTAGEGIQRLLEGQPLAWNPAAGRLAFDVLPADATCTDCAENTANARRVMFFYLSRGSRSVIVR